MTVGSFVRCDHVVELASAYLERALAPSELVALEQHLLICDDCERYVDQLRRMLEATRGLSEGQGDEHDAPAAPESVLALFRRAKGGEP